MCEFCTKHGEGKKWYEVMSHYGKDLANEERRNAYIRNFVPSITKNADDTMSRLSSIKSKIPYAYRFVRRIGTIHMKRTHYGQVVPLEDALEIVARANSITRVACVCRSITTGDKNARYCLLLGIDPSGIIDAWTNLTKSLEVLTVKQAQDALLAYDQKGLVHSVWTFESPFIGALCNCDRGCLAYRFQVSGDLLDVMFKGEYLAAINPSVCIGCRKCLQYCQFGAIEYSVSQRKSYINVGKCYGCGLCRVACQEQAIVLKDKYQLALLEPAASER